MAQEFIYFAGSLPMLFFGEKAPVSTALFDEDALRLIGGKNADLLKKVLLYTEDADDMPPAVQKFYDWENSLRNAMLDFRKKSRPDAVDFKRNSPGFYSEIISGLAQAAASADLLESEKIIDRMRWNAMDNFCIGHYSDLTFLAFYRIKLQILEKYQTRTAEAGNQALENILSDLTGDSEANK